MFGRFYLKFLISAYSRLSITLDTALPKNTEIILGGASCPPSLISLPFVAIEPKYNFALLVMAARLINTNNLNNVASYPFFGTLNKLTIFPSLAI